MLPLLEWLSSVLREHKQQVLLVCLAFCLVLYRLRLAFHKATCKDKFCFESTSMTFLLFGKLSVQFCTVYKRQAVVTSLFADLRKKKKITRRANWNMFFKTEKSCSTVILTLRKDQS